jgi:glucose-6-phosphate dehydrogenase-like protein
VTRIAGPCGVVVFGVTRDLSRKKLIPAIYDLATRGLLPPGFASLYGTEWGSDRSLARCAPWLANYVLVGLVRRRCRCSSSAMPWPMLSLSAGWVRRTRRHVEPPIDPFEKCRV